MAGFIKSWFHQHPSERVLDDIVRRHYEQSDPLPGVVQQNVQELPQAHSPIEDPVPNAQSTLGSKVIKTAGCGIGVLTAAESVNRLYDSPLVNKISQTLTTTASSTAQTVKEAVSSPFETINGYYDSARNMVSWSTFGLGFMGWMPSIVQNVVIGAGTVAVVVGGIALYRFCRYPQTGYMGGPSATTNTNTQNNSVNMLFQVPEHCKPVVTSRTHADGTKDVHFGMVCERPQAPRAQLIANDPVIHDADQRPAAILPMESKRVLTPAGKEKVRGMKKISMAMAYHQRLEKVINDHFYVLSKPLQKQVKGVNLRFNELKERKYVAKSLHTDLAKAGLVLDDVDKEMAVIKSVVARMPIRKKTHQDTQELIKNTVDIEQPPLKRPRNKRSSNEPTID